MVGLFFSRSGLAGLFGGAFGWGVIALVTLNFGETRWGGGAPNGIIGGIVFFMIGAAVGLGVGLLGKVDWSPKQEQQTQDDKNKGDPGSPAGDT